MSENRSYQKAKRKFHIHEKAFIKKLNKELKKIGLEVYLDEDLYFYFGYHKKIKFKAPKDFNWDVAHQTLYKLQDNFENKFFRIYESSGWKLYDKETWRPTRCRGERIDW